MPKRIVTDGERSRSPKAPWPSRRKNIARGGLSLADFFVVPRLHSLSYARSSRLEIVSNLGIPIVHIISFQALSKIRVTKAVF